MTNHKEMFEGCATEIKADENLTINGKEIEYEYDAEHKKWSSRYLPYVQYNTLLEMARAIVRDTVEFSNVKE